jgi:hypothetical protein
LLHEAGDGHAVFRLEVAIRIRRFEHLLTLTDQVLHFTFESAVGLLIIFYSLPVDAKIKLKKGKRLPAINWHISIFAAPSVDWICLFKRPDNYRDRGGVQPFASSQHAKQPSAKARFTKADKHEKRVRPFSIEVPQEPLRV